jgi:regulatory protein
VTKAGPGGAKAPSGPPAGETPEFAKAVQKALAFVLKSTNARPQTEAEVRAKLHLREIDHDVLEEVVTRAKQMRAIDDAAFARAWVEDRGRTRGYGVHRLRQELERRNVPEHLIGSALAALEDRDELSVAMDLARTRAQRMPPALPPETVARRVQGYLVRRGYPPALAQKAAISASGLDRSWD